MSGSSEGQTATPVSGVSCDSLQSWGADTPSANAIDPKSSVDFPAIGPVVENKPILKNPLCRRRRERGHIAKDYPKHQAANPSQFTLTHSIQNDSRRANAFLASKPAGPRCPIENLIDFSQEEERIEAPKDIGNEHDQALYRARKWADLNLGAIRERAKNEEDFKKPLAEPSLMDGDPVTADEARRMADATISVELKRKRNGRKGKAYYDLSPFINYR